MRKTLVLFFLHRSSALLHTALCTYFLLELTHAFSFHADNMLGKGMLAELKALARKHGLATGSQTVPNSVVEKAIVHGRSPPKEPAAQRKKLVLKRPKRKAPQVIHEEEGEDDEVTEDGLVTKRKRVAPSSPPAPPLFPRQRHHPHLLHLHHRHPHKPLLRQFKRSHWPLRHLRLRFKSQTSWRTPRAPPRHMYQLEGVPLQMPQSQRLLQSGMRSLIPHRF